MNNKNYWLRNGIIMLFQNFSTMIFGLLSFYFLLRVLSIKEEYGAWVLFISVVTVMEIGRNGLTQEAIVKYLSSANESDERKINTATFCINMVTTLVIGTVVWFIGPWLSHIWHYAEMQTLLRLYLIAFMLSGVLNQLNCIEQAKLNFVGVFYSNLTRQALFFTFVIYCYISHTEVHLITLTCVQIISIVCATLVAFLYTRRKIKFNWYISREWVKKIFDFGKYTFGVSLNAVLAGAIDQMMLGSFLSKAASAVFNVAIRITNITDIPTNAMVSIVYPQSSRRMDAEGTDAAKYLYEKSVGVILAVLIPTVLFVYIFAGYIIHFVADGKYDESVPLLRITLITCLFGPFGRQAGTIFSSSGKTKLNFYIILSVTFIVIICNYFFIRQWGVMGAAYATLISGASGFVIAQYFLKKYFNIQAQNAFAYTIQFYKDSYNNYLKKLFKK